jgi:hypothetical protein
MQVGIEKVRERKIFRELCHMQVGHMQLFSRNWTPVLPIGSLREGIATGVPALLLGSQNGRRFIEITGVNTFFLYPKVLLGGAMGRTGGDALSRN